MMPAGVAMRFADGRVRLGGRAARQAGRPSRRAACACSLLSVRCGGRHAPACPAPRRRWWDHQTLRDAAAEERLISSVTVTDPRHPLFGRCFAVLSLICARGPRFIAVALPDAGAGWSGVRRRISSAGRKRTRRRRRPRPVPCCRWPATSAAWRPPPARRSPMPSRPRRLVPPPPPSPRRAPMPPPRPALPAQAQRQLARQIAGLPRRVRDEARRADRAR